MSRRGRLLAAALVGTLGIALVFWAQGDFGQRHATRQALVLLLVGAGCAVGAAAAVSYHPLAEPEEKPAATRKRAWHWWRVAALLGAAVCTVLAYWLNDDNLFNGPGVVAWLAAILLFLVAWWEPGAARGAGPKGRLRSLFELRREQLVRLVVPTVALLSIAGLALFFRFHQLSSLPGNAGGIEADIADNVRDILKGRFPIYMPRNIGEGGMLYFTAALVKFLHLPLDYEPLKITTVVAGILAVGATYLLLREAFSDQLVAVIGAAFMSIAHWPVTVSRSALTMASAPAWAAITLLFLIRALKYGRTNDFLLCGLGAGLGLYFYQGLRAMPFLIAACLGLKMITALLERDWKKSLAVVGRGLLLGSMLVIVFAPMARTWHDDPSYYMAAVHSRAAGAGGEQDYNALGRLAHNIQNVFYMFNWHGDSQGLNNIPGSIALDRVMAVLLLLGAALAITAWVRRRRNLFPYLLVALFALLLPSALALGFPWENPSFGRTAGAMPLVYGFVALPVAFVVYLLRRSLPPQLGLAVVSLSLLGLVALLAVSNYRWYFHDYSASYDATISHTADVAAAIEDARKQNDAIHYVYVIGYPGWVDTRGVRLELGGPDWLLSYYPLPGSPRPDGLYVLSADDIESRERLQERYRHGNIEWYSAPRATDSFLLFDPMPPP